ncbi:hypothetical protein [Halobacterium sp. CBA1126]|uniref:hypothetical protein n=1 Tax=Halobacterium TaxID=2239 RepID=UPI0012FCEAD2|nr:hypothetical protein [Halobacterium sp. CBA1126]MUV60918.1 hypothetical protein [Halobacterium sp. CBA1126]
MQELLVSGKAKSDLLPVLKTVNQWICWSYSNHPLRSDKVPVDPTDWDDTKAQFQAKPYNDSDIWLDYESAIEKATTEEEIDGVGFVPMSIQVCFIDIDDCINEVGQVTDEVHQIIYGSESYSEISPSGNGIHIVLQGGAPAYGSSSYSEGPDIEIYDGSWVTITQRHISRTPTEVRGNVGFTKEICDKYDIRRPPDW